MRSEFANTATTRAMVRSDDDRVERLRTFAEMYRDAIASQPHDRALRLEYVRLLITVSEAEAATLVPTTDTYANEAISLLDEQASEWTLNAEERFVLAQALRHAAHLFMSRQDNPIFFGSDPSELKAKTEGLLARANQLVMQLVRENPQNKRFVALAAPVPASKIRPDVHLGLRMSVEGTVSSVRQETTVRLLGPVVLPEENRRTVVRFLDTEARGIVVVYPGGSDRASISLEKRLLPGMLVRVHGLVEARGVVPYLSIFTPHQIEIINTPGPSDAGKSEEVLTIRNEDTPPEAANKQN
jgi:hypothetical protein